MRHLDLITHAILRRRRRMRRRNATILYGGGRSPGRTTAWLREPLERRGFSFTGAESPLIHHKSLLRKRHILIRTQIAEYHCCARSLPPALGPSANQANVPRDQKRTRLARLPAILPTRLLPRATQFRVIILTEQWARTDNVMSRGNRGRRRRCVRLARHSTVRNST